MPEWFLPTRGTPAPVTVPTAVLARTEVADTGGAVVVETRYAGPRDLALPGDRRGDLRVVHDWETTLCPADDPDPNGAAATVFAVCDSPAEAAVAHAQAVEFATAALRSPARGGPPAHPPSDGDT